MSFTRASKQARERSEARVAGRIADLRGRMLRSADPCEREVLNRKIRHTKEQWLLLLSL